MIAKTRPMTVEEYFAYDEASDTVIEFIDGEIYPMPGGTGSHNLLVASAIHAIFDTLLERDCSVYASQMRVRIDPSKYLYPDASIVCGEPEFADDNEVTLINPTVVVEVTSPSSYTHDHKTKLELYGAAPSIQGYLILDQERIFADWYTRAAEGWYLRQYSDNAASIPLEPLDIELPPVPSLQPRPFRR